MIYTTFSLVRVRFVSFPRRRFDAYASGFFFICTVLIIGTLETFGWFIVGVVTHSALCMHTYIYIYIYTCVHNRASRKCRCEYVRDSSSSLFAYGEVKSSRLRASAFFNARHVGRVHRSAKKLYLSYFGLRRVGLIGLYEQSNRSDVFKQSLCDKSRIIEEKVSRRRKRERYSNARARARALKERFVHQS